MTFDAARDSAGLKQAIAELLEEGFAYSRIAPLLDSADDANRERMLRSLPPRNLTEGYYKLGEYLLWLEQHVRIGVPLNQAAAYEANGLCLLSAARHEFEHKHPPCGACGAMQDSQYATACYKCGQEFRRR